MKRAIGVCYYPEHWPREMWEADAAEMAAAGLTWVRIGEFAWSRIETAPDVFDWNWLDEAVGVLKDAGLKVIMGTPTATPPRWMLTKHPDMLAYDAEGRPRGFGSRRHYCFSHDGYREEGRRIAELFAERYGDKVDAWQTDNEYDCHDTAISYSPAAKAAFREWCAQRYQSPDALNRAWGNVFWSMDYADFSDIDLPNLTVTDPNPAHVLAFRRFSSDQVVRFNRVQCEAIRHHSKAPIIHNFMGRITAFDHYDVSADLDVTSWDSYPLGFLMDRNDAPEDFKTAFARQGDPDFQAFHHDLYRTCGAVREDAEVKDGRWWVMEQQPGPVNWAPWNPAPLPGMVRLWAWEAFAHGAEAVLYFRWRQAPFAQEQQHAGLKRPDNEPAPGMEEAKAVAREIETLPEVGTGQSSVALLYDYDSAYAWETQPQGRDFDYFHLVYETYRALRTAGLSIDILPSDRQEYSGYKMIFAPGLLTLDDARLQALSASGAKVIMGPRAGLKTDELSISVPLGPNLPDVDAAVTHTESLPPPHPLPLADGGAIWKWFEHLESDAEVLETTAAGLPVMVGGGQFSYLAGWLEPDALARLVAKYAAAAGLETLALPEGLRVRDTDTHRFWFNYAPVAQEYEGRMLEPGAVLWEAR